MTAFNNSTNFSNDQLILVQLQQMPDALKKEVLDFIGFLFEKHQLNGPKPKKNKPKSAFSSGLKNSQNGKELPSEIIQPIKDDLNIGEMMQEQNWKGTDKAGVFQAIRNMNVEEPVEELLSYLSA